MNEAASFEEVFAHGVAQMRARDHLSEAEALFRAALAIIPRHPAAMLHLGICLRAQGRIGEAIDQLRMAADQNPDDAPILAHLATALRLDGRYDEALALYDRALEHDPNLDYALASRKVARDCARAVAAAAAFEAHRWAEVVGEFDYLLRELALDDGTAGVMRERRAIAAAYAAEEAATGHTHPPEARLERAIALYRRGNQLAIAGDVDSAMRCYDAVMLLDTHYDDPGFPIGETVAMWEHRLAGGRRLSCRWLESGLHLHHEGLFYCCPTRTGGKPWAGVGPYHGGRLPIDIILARRAQLTGALGAGRENVCDGCHFLEDKDWAKPRALFESLIINNHTACNMWCSYCGLAQADFSMPAYAYRVEPVLNDLIRQGWLASGADVAWGGGDPSLSRDFPGGSAALLRHDCTLGIYTNALHVPDPMIEAVRQGKADVWISVDAGTRRTFNHLKFRDRDPLIHGMPMLEAQWTNIARYVEAAPASVFVKYVITEENLSEEEFDAFVARCVAARVAKIILTPENFTYISGQTSRRVADAMVRLEGKAKVAGLDVLYYFFGHTADAAPEGLRDLRCGGPLPITPSLEYLRRLAAARTPV